jgi:DNA-directed RNA polymerase subunit RPC12/RpoP
MKSCPTCHETYPDDVESCPKDGARLSAEFRDERECPYCAERILKKARVCKHCGHDVEPLVGTGFSAQLPSPAPPVRIVEPTTAKPQGSKPAGGGLFSGAASHPLAPAKAGTTAQAPVPVLQQEHVETPSLEPPARRPAAAASRPPAVSASLVDMSKAEKLWREKSDADLLAAAQRLNGYTEEGKGLIRAELRRRGFDETTVQTPSPAPSGRIGAHPTAQPHKFTILLYLGVLFGGVILFDWAISKVFSLPADATYILTKISLNCAMAVAVLGAVFTRQWINLKTTLITTALLSMGLTFWVVSVYTSRNARSEKHLGEIANNVRAGRPDAAVANPSPRDDAYRGYIADLLNAQKTYQAKIANLDLTNIYDPDAYASRESIQRTLSNLQAVAAADRERYNFLLSAPQTFEKHLQQSSMSESDRENEKENIHSFQKLINESSLAAVFKTECDWSASMVDLYSFALEHSTDFQVIDQQLVVNPKSFGKFKQKQETSYALAKTLKTLNAQMQKENQDMSKEFELKRE